MGGYCNGRMPLWVGLAATQASAVGLSQTLHGERTMTTDSSDFPPLSSKPEWGATGWQEARDAWRQIDGSGRVPIREAMTRSARRGAMNYATAALLAGLHEALHSLHGYLRGYITCYMPSLIDPTPKGQLEEAISSKIENCRSALLHQAGFLQKHEGNLDSETAFQLREHIAENISLLENLGELYIKVRGLKEEEGLEPVQNLQSEFEGMLQRPPVPTPHASDAAQYIIAWRPEP